MRTSLCPLNGDNEYNDYVNILLGPNSPVPWKKVSLIWYMEVSQRRGSTVIFFKREVAGSNPAAIPTLRVFKWLTECCLCHEICKQLDFLIFADKEKNRTSRLPALSFICFLWDVKEPIPPFEKSNVDPGGMTNLSWAG